MRFSDCKKDLLKILEILDELWRTGKIEEGIYRQKGNLFKDTISALIEARCGISVKETKLKGRTDIHKVDLGTDYVTIGSVETVIIAGEVKMLGSPPHLRGGVPVGERPVSIDIDKRIKEVKYTPIDLKRLLNPSIEEGWDQWLEKTPPAFFSFWLLRLGTRNHVDKLMEKFRGLTEYNNGVAVEAYKEENEKYVWTELPYEEYGILTIDAAIDQICEILQKQKRQNL